MLPPPLAYLYGLTNHALLSPMPEIPHMPCWGKVMSGVLARAIFGPRVAASKAGGCVPPSPPLRRGRRLSYPLNFLSSRLPLNPARLTAPLKTAQPRSASPPLARPTRPKREGGREISFVGRQPDPLHLLRGYPNLHILISVQHLMEETCSKCRASAEDEVFQFAISNVSSLNLYWMSFHSKC